MQDDYASITQWLQPNYPTFKEEINAALEKGSLIFIDIGSQMLRLLHGGEVVSVYPISTSRNGVGNKQDSYQTPLGLHKVAQKRGGHCQKNEIIKARTATGQIAEINKSDSVKNDVITSRILWLEGMEEGINKGADVDSFQRYIYIHGTADEQSIGTPASIGCVRMKNDDVINLYQHVKVGALVIIKN